MTWEQAKIWDLESFGFDIVAYTPTRIKLNYHTGDTPFKLSEFQLLEEDKEAALFEAVYKSQKNEIDWARINMKITPGIKPVINQANITFQNGTKRYFNNSETKDCHVDFIDTKGRTTTNKCTPLFMWELDFKFKELF